MDSSCSADDKCLLEFRYQWVWLWLNLARFTCSPLYASPSSRAFLIPSILLTWLQILPSSTGLYVNTTVHILSVTKPILGECRGNGTWYQSHLLHKSTMYTHQVVKNEQYCTDQWNGTSNWQYCWRTHIVRPHALLGLVTCTWKWNGHFCNNYIIIIIIPACSREQLCFSQSVTENAKVDYTFFALLLRDCNAVRNEQIVIIADILISQEFLWDADYFGYDWNLSVNDYFERQTHV